MNEADFIERLVLVLPMSASAEMVAAAKEAYPLADVIIAQPLPTNAGRS